MTKYQTYVLCENIHIYNLIAKVITSEMKKEIRQIDRIKYYFCNDMDDKYIPGTSSLFVQQDIYIKLDLLSQVLTSMSTTELLIFLDNNAAKIILEYCHVNNMVIAGFSIDEIYVAQALLKLYLLPEFEQQFYLNKHLLETM